MKYCRTR